MDWLRAHGLADNFFCVLPFRMFCFLVVMADVYVDAGTTTSLHRQPDWWPYATERKGGRALNSSLLYITPS